MGKIVDASIATEAVSLVDGDRNTAYGHPADDFQRIADAWRAVFGWDATAEQVGLAFILAKVARHVHSYKRDNLVDICGYALTVDAVHRARA